MNFAHSAVKCSRNLPAKTNNTILRHLNLVFSKLWFRRYFYIKNIWFHPCHMLLNVNMLSSMKLPVNLLNEQSRKGTSLIRCKRMQNKTLFCFWLIKPIFFIHIFRVFCFVCLLIFKQQANQLAKQIKISLKFLTSRN